MSARTCMLCGKALSRIWSGSGEGFCSREHRNQYRLRRGMDRLLEANKVANVMRRRENPRQIPTASLRSTGPASQRGFGPRPPRDLQLAAFGRHKTRPVLQNRFESSLEFRPPHANRGREHGGGAVEATPVPFEAQRPLPPPVAFSMPAQIVQAPPSELVHAVSHTPSTGLVLDIPWWGQPLRVTEMPRRETPTFVTALVSAPPAQRIAAACEGRALRVSLAAGFRIPEWKLAYGGLAGPEIRGMIWPDIRSLKAPSKAGQASPTIFAMPIAPPAARTPAAPPANFERRFEWPGVIRVRVQFVDCTTGRLIASAPFGCADDSCH
jgi:hypothetical protein